MDKLVTFVARKLKEAPEGALVFGLILLCLLLVATVVGGC